MTNYTPYYIGYGIGVFVFLLFLVLGIILVVKNVKRNKQIDLSAGGNKQYAGMIMGILLLVLCLCCLITMGVSLLILLFIPGVIV